MEQVINGLDSIRSNLPRSSRIFQLYLKRLRCIVIGQAANSLSAGRTTHPTQLPQPVDSILRAQRGPCSLP